MRDSKKGKNRLSRTKAVSDTISATQRDSLCRLPNELLLEIIEYLLDDSIKPAQNHRKKINQGITLESGQKTSLWLYQHDPKSPIMSDFQSFSVVNRKIYSICRPIIWKVSLIWRTGAIELNNCDRLLIVSFDLANHYLCLLRRSSIFNSLLKFLLQWPFGMKRSYQDKGVMSKF